MYITNSLFSAEEKQLLDFILSQPFSERDKTVDFINSLDSASIVRDYTSYYRIIEFCAKGVTEGCGMKETVTACLQYPDSDALTVFTLYEKDGSPFEFEIYNADSSEINISAILRRILNARGQG